MAKKILVIDDDPSTVTYLVNLFCDNGYHALAAADGGEALEVMKQEKPDLITLDLDMPEEYGTKFYRKFIKDEEYKHIPVIVISGLTRPERAIKRAVATFEKPFEPEDLLKVVKETIG